MPICATINVSRPPLRLLSLHTPNLNPFFSPSLSLNLPKPSILSLSVTRSTNIPLIVAFSTNAATNSEINAEFSHGGGVGDDGGNSSGGGGGGGGGGDGNEGNDDKNRRKNKEEALIALAEAGRSLESLPKDLRNAVQDGRIPASIVLRYFDLEKSKFISWLMKFGGFKERLLADDLFLAKIAMECGVGVFTKVVEIAKNQLYSLFL